MTLEGRRVLYISYNGMLEPLGQSQVLPYLRELAGQGVRFTLLSFERAGALGDAGQQKCGELREHLAGYGIEWHYLRYHRRPSMPATMYDVAAGIRASRRLVRRNGIELIHARSHIPATIGLATKSRRDIKLIFDLRGLMAEEYVDAEHWSEGSVPYRVTKLMERRIFSGTDAVVTLTEKIWPIIKDWEGLRDREVRHEVVPCCVDLDRFRFNEPARQTKRSELGLSDDGHVLVYSGSIGGWYLTDKMADFFSTIAKADPSWHFLWLTAGSTKLIDDLMNERGLGHHRYTIKHTSLQEVPSYLSAADAAIAFYKPALSRLATSPVKVSEYLACGLPIIINTGIGDCDALITHEAIGALIESFTEADYMRGYQAIQRMVANPVPTRERTREVAERLFDLRTVGAIRYARLYEAVLTNGNAE